MRKFSITALEVAGVVGGLLFALGIYMILVWNLLLRIPLFVGLK